MLEDWLVTRNLDDMVEMVTLERLGNTNIEDRTYCSLDCHLEY